MNPAPSIILIVGDHHRAEFLRGAGCRLAHTPSLDKLCQTGAVFSRAVTIFPQADIALQTLLAGVHAHRLAAGAPPGLPQSPLGSALATAGYRVAEIGGLGSQNLAEVLGQALAFLEEPKAGLFLALIMLPPIGTFEDIPDRCLAPYRGNGTPLPAYFGAVTAYDAAAGEIVEAAERRADRSDTLVVYTSLSGEHFKYRDSVSHANTCHNDSIRVPLIFNWPARIEPGRLLDPLVGLHDVAPTIAEIAGVRLPNPQGRSLWPLLSGSAQPEWRERIYIENRHQRHIRPKEDATSASFRLYPAWRQRAIWDGRHKLVLSADQGRASLFDHAIDPEEEFDLYDVPRPSPHRLYEHFRDRRRDVVRLARELREEARAVADHLGVEIATAAIADPKFGKLGAGEPVG